MKKFLIALAVIFAANSAYAQTEYENSQVICLAKNIYFEARSSSYADQIAVADVVMNRVESTSYPNTICGVVQQGYVEGRRDCQFSWYCDGKSDRIPDIENNDHWWDALDIASDMYFNGNWRGLTEGATNYHATYVRPAWRHNLDLVGRIGEHIYYRAK